MVVAQGAAQEQQGLDIKAHEPQRIFCRSAAPTVVFQGGVGSGKTWAGVVWALVKKAMGQPGSAGMIVAATFPMLRQATTPHLQRLAEQTGQSQTWQWNRAENVIQLENGSTIYLRSAENPDSLLGADLAWAYGDELGLWRHDAYRYLMGRLRQTGFEHQAAFTFTPKGTTHWTYEELGRRRDGIEIIRVSTHDNPSLSPDVLERLRREYGEGSPFWQQEVAGEYVAFEGLVYPEFSQERHVRVVPPEGVRWVRVVAGVDWGWTNPGVILVLGLDAEDRVWIIGEEYAEGRPVTGAEGTASWVTAAHQLHEAYGVEAFYCDPSEPGNIDAFRRAGLPAEKADNAVVPGIAAVASRLGNETMYIHPTCTNTIREIMGYCWRQGRDGIARHDEPQKVDDHACDALRYAVLALCRPRAMFSQLI